MHSPIVVSFGFIFVAELVDKTLLVTLLLATRYRSLPVLFGAWAGFTFQTGIAVAAGSLLSNLPSELLRWCSVAAFALFGLVMLLKDESLEEEANPKRRGPFVLAFLAILLAEWGDATQVGTLVLTTRFHSPVQVFAGALGGLWAGAGIAVLIGRRLGQAVHPRWLRRAGGIVFLAIAVIAAIWRR